MNDIICCDCVKGLQSLQSNSVELVLTSPPWDNIKIYGGGANWNFKETAQELWRVTKKGGVVCWHVGDSVNVGESLTSFRQALYFQHLGFAVNTIAIEAIGNTPHGRYERAVQYVFCCSKGKVKIFNPLRDVPTTTVGVRDFHDTTPTGRRHNYKDVEVSPWRYRTAVWKQGIPTHNKTINHPAPMISSLARDLIRSYSNPGMTVVDPFMGSGTTACEAVNLGRQYLGFEIHMPYVVAARQRVAETIARMAG